MTHSSNDFTRPFNPLCEAVSLESQAEAMTWTKDLLEAGEDPNAVRIETEFSPLEIAWSMGRLMLMKMLLEAGAVAGIEDRLEHIFWMQSQPVECTQLMISHGYTLENWSIHELPDGSCERIGGYWNPLYELASEEHWDTIEALRPHGIMEFLGVYNDLGHAPLQSAVDDNNIQLVRWLLARGADVNAHCEARIGSTALDIAVEEKNLDIARVLIHAGANPNIPTCMWNTAVDRVVNFQTSARKPGQSQDNGPDLPAIRKLVMDASKNFAPPMYPNGTTPAVWPPVPKNT